MLRAGRNDPCPCGSGRKYKNCCMRRDQLEDSLLRAAPPLPTALFAELLDFALDERFAEDVVNAFQVYWGGEYGAKAQEFSDIDSQRWLEWFAHDYRLGEERRRPIELFAEGPGRTLDPMFIEILDSWLESTMGLYRVEDIKELQLNLNDLLRERELLVEDETLARNAHRGDLVVGRLYKWGESLRFTPSAMLLPSDFEQAMVEYVRNAYNTFRSMHPEADWDAFLRENSHIFVAFLLSPRGEALRPRLGVGTVYADLASTRDRLAEAARRYQREALEREAHEYGEPPERRTASGLVLPGYEQPDEPEQRPRTPTGSQILIPGRDE